MIRSRPAPQILAFVGLVLGLALSPWVARADTVAQGAGLAVADFTYVDSSDEPVDQTAEHRRRLQTLMAALRRDLTADQRLHLVPLACGPAPCTDDPPTPPDLLRTAAQAGAKFLVIGGVHKTSTLVQWMKVQAIDIDANRVVFDRLFTFRGDSDEAWARAETFLARDLLPELATPVANAATAPVKLAIFDFELEDFSAVASPTGTADAAQLAGATGEVRQLLARSGRYSVVEVGGADAAEAKTHTLRDCDGCDAAIARQLGAEQSLVGVVRRISRTEYTVRFVIRDARTGGIVSGADSGLRMGADYSWRRGAARLIEDRLLESRNPQ